MAMSQFPSSKGFALNDFQNEQRHRIAMLLKTVAELIYEVFIMIIDVS